MTNKFNMYADSLDSYYEETVSMLHSYETTKNANNDTYTFSKMLQVEDRADFIQAMKGELEDHNARGHWEIMDRNKMISKTKTIMSIWSFKRNNCRFG